MFSKMSNRPAPGVHNPESGFTIEHDSNWREGKSIGSLLEYSYKNGLCHDIQFVTGDRERIPCSKFILRLRSPYFEELLKSNEHDNDESTSIINLLNENPEHFRTMIKYLYTDKLDVSHKNVLYLRCLAREYKIAGMEQALSSEALLDCELNANNAVSLYQMAQALGENIFRDRAMEFIINNMTSVTGAEDFFNLTYRNLCRILERGGLVIEEIKLLRSVIRWGQMERNRTNMDISQILQRPFQSVCYFPSLENDYFAGAMLAKAGIELPLEFTAKIRSNPTVTDLANTAIDCKNVIKYLKVAAALEIRDSTIAAFEFMESNAQSLFAGVEFLQLYLEHFQILLKSDKLIVGSELVVFLGVKRWAIAECRRRCINFTPENMRQILGNSVFLIRFIHLNFPDFVIHVVENSKGLLLQEEINDITLYYKSTAHEKRQKASNFKFPTKRRIGYKMYSVEFLPNKVSTQVNQILSRLNLPNVPNSSLFSSITTKFDGHFWRAFMVDRPISLISFGFYGPSEDNARVDVEISVREMAKVGIFEEPGVLIVKRRQIIKGLPKQDIFHVEFKEPIKLKAKVVYVVGFCIKTREMFAHRTVQKDLELPSNTIEVRLDSGATLKFNVISNDRSSVRIAESGAQQYFYTQFPEINFVL